jgi:hypothetical protein
MAAHAGVMRGSQGIALVALEHRHCQATCELRMLASHLPFALRLGLQYEQDRPLRKSEN